MRIRNVVHKGMRRFLDNDEVSGLPAASVDKIRKILTVLQDIGAPEELQAFPGWKAHRLGGDKKGVWSLTVTRNWRITFSVDETQGEILDLNFEDYH
ncbi:MAG: type II toxin-antitoxin system RelE/ParE family toxin [Pseudomonadota bacterium]|nr:type II toxin-antitoxin system RelE/ParE family toxin [Pseudomonadota bacterium]